MISRRITAVCCLLAFSHVTSSAFVFPYLVPGRPLRWTPNAPGYPTNVVNPVTKKIRYFVSSDLYSSANKTNELTAVRASFHQWQSVPGAKIAFEEGGLVPPGRDLVYDNTNVVFWAKTNLLVASGTENISGRRGWTSVVWSADDGRILEADIVLNGLQFQWFTDFNNATNTGQFIESVLLHEIGHFLGLDHSPAGGATLANGGSGVGPQAGLSADDIAAARFLYPDPAQQWGTIKGRVTRNGAGISGAVVAVSDSNGNIAGATVTRDNGEYEVFSLPLGEYSMRVSPLDPSNTTDDDSLLRGGEIAPEYVFAVTDFKPAMTNISISSTQLVTRNITVLAGEPPFRITSMGGVSSQPDVVAHSRFAVSLAPGQSNYYLSVLGPKLLTNSILSVTGNGISMGGTVFKPNRRPGLHALTALISVSSNATPGLRTLVVQQGTNSAFAHGFLEISAVPDFNFDGLDDRFQRQYWPVWYSGAGAPSADPDADRFSNDYEYRTGSNPTNALSHNFLIQKVRYTQAGAEVTWQSDIGKRYQLYGRAAFATNSIWQPIGAATMATNSTTTVKEPAAGQPSEKFYRLQLLPKQKPGSAR